MRICLVCQEYPPDTLGGGIGTYTANIARGLAAAGHAVSVIARAVKGPENSSLQDGVWVHRVYPARAAVISNLLRSYGDKKTFADTYLYSRAVCAKVHAIMEVNGLDIVQSPEHGAEGFTLAMNGTRIPHIVRFHTPLFMVNEAVGVPLSLGGRVVDAMERVVSRRAVLNTCASRALAGVVAARFGIAQERIRIVPNFIDYETFTPANHPTPHPPTVLYVGKVAPLKGARTLAEAIPRIVRRIPDVKMMIAGSDHAGSAAASAKAEMLEHLHRSGGVADVTFLPTMPRRDLVRIYQQADVYVFPTLWDNFPNTCLEAMACGVPVVASAVGGLPEIIDGGRNGVLIPPGDSARLAEAVVQLLEQPERRLAMGRAARQKILSAYSRERVVDATVAVYEEAITRHRARISTG